jgi:ADP-ribosylglycohydrolase
MSEVTILTSFKAQIAIEALEQWRGGPVAAWEAWLCRAQTGKAEIAVALEAYCLGDRLGAPWESGSAHWAPVAYIKIVQRANNHPKGTDEADTVRCFERFVAGYNFDGDTESLLVCWARFHSKHYRPTSYGGTWRNYFATVKALDKKGNLGVDRLYTLAADCLPGGSAGNGCLALALPVYAYAKRIGLEPVTLMQAFFRISHSSAHALGCAAFLCSLFEALLDPDNDHQLAASCAPIRQFFAQQQWRMAPEAFARHYPNNMLCCYTVVHALYANFNAGSGLEMITAVVSMGGDVDSVLALAMLLFQLFYPNQVNHHRWQKLAAKLQQTMVNEEVHHA